MYDIINYSYCYFSREKLFQTK